MALAARSERHNAPIGKRSPVAAPRPRARLAVVPRRTRTARFVGTIAAGIVVLMIGAVAFQVQLARRQLTLDTLDRRIREASDNYDVLRRERAELRSPGRLVAEATRLGMTPPSEAEYVAVDADVVAVVQRTGLRVDASNNSSITDDFAAYAALKSRAGGAP